MSYTRLTAKAFRCWQSWTAKTAYLLGFGHGGKSHPRNLFLKGTLRSHLHIRPAVLFGLRMVLRSVRAFFTKLRTSTISVDSPPLMASCFPSSMQAALKSWFACEDLILPRKRL